MPSTHITIRPAALPDAAQLAALGARTFLAAYPDVEPAALSRFVRATFSLGRQTTELTDPAVTVLLAECLGAAIGYAMVRADVAHDLVTARRPLTLSRLYLDTDAQGRGIGSALVAAVLDRAAAADQDVCWLTVWEHNTRAIAAYRHWGFTDVGGEAFDLAGVRQVDRVMARRITPGTRGAAIPGR